MSTFTGKDLQQMIIDNRKSIKGSAEKLNISVKELESYFLFTSFEDDFLNNILKKLELVMIIKLEVYKILTPFALDIIEGYKKRHIIQSEVIDNYKNILKEIGKGIINESSVNRICDEINKMTTKTIELENRMDFYLSQEKLKGF